MHFTLNIGTCMFAALVFSSQFNGYQHQFIHGMTGIPLLPPGFLEGISFLPNNVLNITSIGTKTPDTMTTITTTMAGDGNSVETDTNNNNTVISTVSPDDQQPPVGNSTADSDINSTTSESGSDTTSIHTGADTTGVTSNENTQQSQTQAPSVSSGVKTTSEKPKSKSSGMTWILIAVIVVVVVALILILCICVIKNRDSSEKKSIPQSTSERALPTKMTDNTNKVGSIKSGPQSPIKLDGKSEPPPPPPPPPPPLPEISSAKTTEKTPPVEKESDTALAPKSANGQPIVVEESNEDPTHESETTVTDTKSDETVINIDAEPTAEPTAAKSNGP
ncbi:integrator complex subunit 6 homolog [Oppia nitens]|uniref:integrator complex subunit 6 homolog n=1 Tax=Oppia nitens TaxID=1686743 RepID=UPI0023DB4CD5|nr:integrator complex subunit 6 homolog [Oppia nitens]